MTGQTFFHRSGSLATLLILLLLLCKTHHSTSAPSSTSPPSNCTMAWPQLLENDTCPLLWCKNDQGIYLPIANWQGQSTKACGGHNYLVAYTNCPEARIPVAPRNLFVSVPFDHDPLGFNIYVSWDDPPEAKSCNLLGYRLTLSNDKFNLQLFEFRKEISAGKPGQNKVTLKTDINQEICSNCMWLAHETVQALFKAPYKFSVAITSLPLKSNQPGDIAAATSAFSFNTGACDSPWVDCLNGLVYKYAAGSHICSLGYVFGDTGTLKSDFYCTCTLRHVFNISSVELGNSTVNVSYVWQQLAPANAVVVMGFDLYWNISMVKARSKVQQEGHTLSWNAGRQGTTLFSCRDALVPGMVVGIQVFRVDISSSLKYSYMFVVPDSPDSASSDVGVRPFTFHLAQTSASTHHPSPTTYLHDGPSTDGPSVSLTILVSAAALLVLGIAFVIVFLWRHAACAHIRKGWRPKPNPTQEMDVNRYLPRCYISYSRFTQRSKSNAERMSRLLNARRVIVVLDVEHRHEMADNVPVWVEMQIANADCVIVLLDEAYPGNLGSGAVSEMLKYDSSGELHISRHESMVLQSAEFCGKSQNVIPVFVGAGSCMESCTPPVLRSKTVYHLPVDFNGESEKFQSLLLRIKTKAPEPFNETVCMGV